MRLRENRAAAVTTAALFLLSPTLVRAQDPSPTPDSPVSAAAATGTAPAATGTDTEPAPKTTASPPSVSPAAGPSSPVPQNAAAPASPVAPPSDATSPPPPASKAVKRFQISSADGDSSLKIGGLVQGDGRFFLDGAGTDTFAIRRARLDLKATLSKYFGFRLHSDIADSKLNLLDAYATVAFIDELQLQVGKMKSPIGLELLQAARDTAFPELGLPSLLVPNRDIGAVLLGDVLGGTISYSGGVFNGAANGTNGDEDENNEKEYEGRLFISPFKTLGVEALAGFGAGIAGSYGEEDGALPSYRSPGRQTFFSFAETATASGERTRVSPQGYCYFGPLGLLAEYVHSKERVTDGSTTRGVTAKAWQVVGSFVLFGGRADYKGTKVQSPLDPAGGTWGALELSARYGSLDIEEHAFAGALADPEAAAHLAKGGGVAASWWFTTGTRAHVALDHTSFKGGASNGARETENVLVTRLQVAL